MRTAGTGNRRRGRELDAQSTGNNLTKSKTGRCNEGRARMEIEMMEKMVCQDGWGGEAQSDEVVM